MRAAIVATVVVTDNSKNEGEEGYQTTSTYLLWRSDTNDSLYLYVNKRNITLVSASATRAYDGTVLTDEHVYAYLDDPNLETDEYGIPRGDYTPGFVAGQGAGYSFAVDAFRRNVGSVYNVFSYKLGDGVTSYVDADGNAYTPALTLESNYSITKRYGVLTVTAN